jgi:undecaprenyl-diphosphatase
VSELGYGWAVLLGVIQGLTEFLPVSSSAHLALAQRWFGLDPSGLTMLLFDLLAHVGTVVSVFIVFWEPIRHYARRLVGELHLRTSDGALSLPPSRSIRASAGAEGGASRRYALRIALLALCALVPTGIIGLSFKEFFEESFSHDRGIGLDLVVTGVLLALTATVPRGRRGWKDFRAWHAVVIGIAQGIAILPGISRSGATIAAAVFLGIRRRWAAEFSFCIAIPAILAAAAIKFMDALELGEEGFAALPWGPIVVGSAISLLMGIVSLHLLLGAVRQAKLHYFAVYCWIVGGLVASGML